MCYAHLAVLQLAEHANLIPVAQHAATSVGAERDLEVQTSEARAWEVG